MIVPACEYGLHRELSDSLGTINSLVNSLFVNPSLEKVIILNSIFLRNRQMYCFDANNASIISPNNEAHVDIEMLIESSFNKGHLSVLFAFDKAIKNDALDRNKFTVKEIDLSSDNTPVSDKQAQGFMYALRLLKHEGAKSVYCFSHDADYMYEIDLSMCEL